jgi:hypothetical protein
MRTHNRVRSHSNLAGDFTGKTDAAAGAGACAEDVFSDFHRAADADSFINFMLLWCRIRKRKPCDVGGVTCSSVRNSLGVCLVQRFVSFLFS